MGIPNNVINSYDNEEMPNCPICGPDEEVFRFVPIGEDTEIDTIGSVRICSTEEGAYFHP